MEGCFLCGFIEPTQSIHCPVCRRPLCIRCSFLNETCCTVCMENIKWIISDIRWPRCCAVCTTTKTTVWFKCTECAWVCVMCSLHDEYRSLCVVHGERCTRTGQIHTKATRHGRCEVITCRVSEICVFTRAQRKAPFPGRYCETHVRSRCLKCRRVTYRDGSRIFCGECVATAEFRWTLWMLYKRNGGLRKRLMIELFRVFTPSDRPRLLK